jgi:hypothetical protein
LVPSVIAQWGDALGELSAQPIQPLQYYTTVRHQSRLVTMDNGANSGPQTEDTVFAAGVGVAFGLSPSSQVLYFSTCCTSSFSSSSQDMPLATLHQTTGYNIYIFEPFHLF